MKTTTLLLLSFILIPFSAKSQQKKTGPVIRDYGAVWAFSSADLPADPAETYRAVFDIMQSPEATGAINPWIETAARFLNMHAQAGVAPERLHAALVVHNQASRDLLGNREYRERYGMDNPNAHLLKSLMEAGVEIVLCGQSSIARNVPVEKTVTGVQLSLSAMTALIHYQNAGYRLIKF